MNLLFIKLSTTLTLLLTLNIQASDIKYLDDKFTQAYHYEPTYEKYPIKTCLKYKKNGESFWENYETDFFSIVAIGELSYKVKQIRFPKGFNDIWFFDKENKKETITFIEQNNFYLTACPQKEDKISNKELSKILE